MQAKKADLCEDARLARSREFSAFNSFNFVKFLLLPAAFDVGTSVSA